ncbi:MAG: (4Fe-4S)-binding protein [Deferribacteres bacterium]|nr:(4Fe-4S)-binding protein [Deferribacteres bacterium]
MKIAVASGKGGAGKTSVAVSLALAAERCVFVDCDVEEPNAFLFLNPQIEREDVATLPLPVVDESRCDFCKKCSEACQFNAIAVLPQKVLVFDKLCRGCGTCVYVCPEKAIYEVERGIGYVEVGRAEAVHFIAGRLNVGEALATSLIRQVKRRIPDDCAVVIDAPPGITCPVVEALKGVDFVLVVAESTPFGYHDFLLLEELLKELGIAYGVVENKVGLSRKSRVKEYCEREGIPLLMEIPYRFEFAQAYSRGIPLINADEELFYAFRELWEKLEELV